MEVKVKVKRFDPEAEAPESYWTDYQVEVDRYTTVLDALINIREDMDGTLSLRCSRTSRSNPWA